MTRTPRTPISEFAVAVGARLRDLRKRRGRSQRKLASLIGITQSAMSTYETGHRDVPVWVLLATLVELDCPAGQFFDGIPGFAAFGNAGATEATIAARDGF